MDYIVKTSGLRVSIFCLVLFGLSLPSAASQGGAKDLQTKPIKLSESTAKNLETGNLETGGPKFSPSASNSVFTQVPTFSFTRFTEKSVANLTSNQTYVAMAPFAIAQATDVPTVDPSPLDPSPTVEPSPTVDPSPTVEPTPSSESSPPPVNTVEPTPSSESSPPPVNIDVQSPKQLPSSEEVQPTRVEPGRRTRSGPSYVGIGANLGAVGGSSVGDTGLMLYSKVGLTSFFSVRPAVTTNFTDDATFLFPATFDFAPIRLGSISGNEVSVAPYFGAGAAVTTDGDLGPLITAGVDVPLTSRLTATVGLNAGFIDDVDFGAFVGVGYNF